MKSVLISIKPKWCEKICHEIGKEEAGKPIYEKRIEVRKTAPKEVPFKAYIYETKGATEMPWVDEDGHFIYKGRGQVIGEFICDKVYNIEPIFSFYGCYSGYDDSSDSSYFEDYSIDDERLKKTCLTRQDLYIYGKDKPLYGWHISDLKIYDKPKPIMQFYKPCPIEIKNCPVCEFYSTNTGCCMNNVDRPPQSYMYVEEL